MSDKERCIVLNKTFVGEWLKGSEDNVAHEIINFFKADDGNIYIYNTPYGANVANSENYYIEYLFLTSAKTNGKYYLEYCIEIEKSLHYISIGKNEKESNLNSKIKKGKEQIEEALCKKLGNINYDGIPITKLFSDPIKVLPFTFQASKIYKAKELITIDEKDFAVIDPETNKVVKDYNFARNFGYVLENKNSKIYNELKKSFPENAPQGFWEEQIINSFKLLNATIEDNKNKIKALDSNLFLDLIDNYKAEECYTKILYKLMKLCPEFTKTIVKKLTGKEYNEEFEVEVEYNTNPGRIDLLAHSEECLVVIENKIDSNITVTNNTSQLKKYDDWVNNGKEEKTFNKNVHNKHFVIIAPDYRLHSITLEEKYWENKEHFNNYEVKGYSKVYEAFNECKKNDTFSNFKYKQYIEDIGALLLRQSLDMIDLYTAKLTKQHI